MRCLFIRGTFLALTACGPKVDISPNVVFETELGQIEIEVYPEKAPISAGDFLGHVDRQYYNNQGFYRVVRPDNDPREMGMSLIQGGRLDVENVMPFIAHETTQDTGLRNDAGSVAIARDEPGTGSAAYFFINVGNNNYLDYGGERNSDGQGYAVFGKVVRGMDVVKEIQKGEANRPTDSEYTKGQYLTTPIIITKAYRK